jgi:hypothetical protein
LRTWLRETSTPPSCLPIASAIRSSLTVSSALPRNPKCVGLGRSFLGRPTARSVRAEIVHGQKLAPLPSETKQNKHCHTKPRLADGYLLRGFRRLRSASRTRSPFLKSIRK